MFRFYLILVLINFVCYNSFLFSEDEKPVTITIKQEVFVGFKRKVECKIIKNVKSQFVDNHGALLDSESKSSEVSLIYIEEVLEVDDKKSIKSKIIFEKAELIEFKNIVRYPIELNTEYIVIVKDNNAQIYLNNLPVKDEVLNKIDVSPISVETVLVKNLIVDLTVEENLNLLKAENSDPDFNLTNATKSTLLKKVVDSKDIYKVIRKEVSNYEMKKEVCARKKINSIKRENTSIVSKIVNNEFSKLKSIRIEEIEKATFDGYSDEIKAIGKGEYETIKIIESNYIDL